MAMVNLGFFADQVQPGFITRWTVAGDATARTITLPLVAARTEGALAYNCTVDWGDGSALSTITSYNDANRVHEYASNGSYNVEIKGTCEGWSFNYGGDRLKIVAVVDFGGPAFNGWKYLRSGFDGCTNLASIGTRAIPASGTGVLSQGFSSTFNSCPITAIPSGLFDKNTLADTFYGTFYGCPITSIPAGLFDKNTLVTDFSYTFVFCPITSIPAGLFDKNTLVTTFYATFNSCPITAIPAGLFDKNTLADTFYGTFYGCPITSIPAGLFDKNVLVTDFSTTFVFCPITSTPAGLFDKNTLVTNFSYTFYECTKLQSNSEIFCMSGGEATRFLNKSVNFTNCFDRASFTGAQGTAPDLWNYDFGTGTPTKTECFSGAGNSLLSLDNYADIPADWIV